MSNERGNSGYLNSGDRNSGNRNSGNLNSGNLNSGNLNSGDRNSGNLNSGDLNSGDRNSGNLNSGNRNSGYLNSGDRNSGNLNSGNLNSGDLNSGTRNSGYLCTETPSPIFFDKPWNGTWEEADSLVPWIDLPVGCEFIATSSMTEEEKTANPNHATIGGYLKVLCKTVQEAFPIAWAKLDDEEKQRWLDLPNFDAEKFLKCTGVDVRLEKKAEPQAEVVQPKQIVIDGVTYNLVPA